MDGKPFHSKAPWEEQARRMRWLRMPVLILLLALCARTGYKAIASLRASNSDPGATTLQQDPAPPVAAGDIAPTSDPTAEPTTVQQIAASVYAGPKTNATAADRAAWHGAGVAAGEWMASLPARIRDPASTNGDPLGGNPTIGTTSQIVIRNAAENGGVVHFLVDREVYSLQPGQSESFPAGRKYRIHFDRGADFGNSLLEISAGEYQFAVTDRGWQLAPQSGPKK